MIDFLFNQSKTEITKQKIATNQKILQYKMKVILTFLTSFQLIVNHPNFSHNSCFFLKLRYFKTNKWIINELKPMRIKSISKPSRDLCRKRQNEKKERNYRVTTERIVVIKLMTWTEYFLKKKINRNQKKNKRE